MSIYTNSSFDCILFVCRYRYAAEQGESQAVHSLSLIYKHGVEGIAADTEKAQEWMNRLATLKFEPMTTLASNEVLSDITQSPSRSGHLKLESAPNDFNTTRTFQTPNIQRINGQNIHSVSNRI